MREERIRKFSISDAVAVAEDLEVLLRSLGIATAPGSTLERMTLSAYDVNYQRTLRIPSGLGSDIRNIYGDVGALSELALQLLRVRDHPDVEQLIPHLQLLNRGEVSQNRPHSVLDDVSNKLFELYAACLMMRTGARLTLEDPLASGGGENPDVIASFHSERWGVACKVLHSKNPQTILDNIITGVKQIERAPVDTGFVFLNFKNLLNHDNYWGVLNRAEWERGENPIFSALDWESATSMLKMEMDSHRAAIVAHAGNGAPIQALFRGQKALPVVVLYAHVMSGIVVGGHPAPMTIKFPYFLRIGEVPDDALNRFELINHYIMDIPGPED